MRSDEFIEPWFAIDAERGATLVRELRNEICRDHVLNGRSVRAVAMRQDCDDVLFEITDSPAGYAVVHLTWSTKKESDRRFPFTELFPLFDDFVVKRMKPDHEDFAA